MKDLSATIIILSAFFVITLGVVGTVLFRIAQGPQPPLEYTQHSYLAETVQLRTGQHLRYTPELIVRESGRVDILRSYWSIDKSADAVLCDGTTPAPTETISRNRPKGIIGNIRGGRYVDTPVPNLPKGKYLYLTSASGPGRGQSDYEVYFEVVSNCGNG